MTDFITPTQADRDAAANAVIQATDQTMQIRLGEADHLTVVQAFARHRISHSLPGDVDAAAAWLFDNRWSVPHPMGCRWQEAPSSTQEAWTAYAKGVAAALTPSPCPGDVGMLAEQAARSAMFAAEVARTDVVKPVNGAAPYTVVSYHGQRIEFHDGEWTIEMHRDAGTGNAAAFAQAVNDGLFDLAKRAALAALTTSPCPGDVGMREALERIADATRYVDNVYAKTAHRIATAALTPSALSGDAGEGE